MYNFSYFGNPGIETLPIRGFGIPGLQSLVVMVNKDLYYYYYYYYLEFMCQECA